MGKWVSPWRKRRERKQVEAWLDHILAELEEGVHYEDILVWELAKPIEWDVRRQTWKVSVAELGFDPILRVGELLSLRRGRGDAEEQCRVISGLGEGWYSVRFDIENRLQSS